MTALCQNGWPVIDSAADVGRYTIPGTDYQVALRPGDTSVILLDWLSFIHHEVEPLLVPGVWGWAVRKVRGSTTDNSNHSGGDAVDASAPRHPLGTDPAKNWLPNPQQIDRMHRRLAAYRKVTGGITVVRWGGDYTGRKDGMHAETLGTAGQRTTLADAIRGGVLPDGELSYLVGRDSGWRVANPTTSQEDDDMPQLVSITVPVGADPTPIVIAPPEDGAARWGKGWLTVLPDRAGKGNDPFRGRLVILGANGAWRPALGKDFMCTLELGKPVTVNLVKGDRAVVVSDTTAALGLCVEYARA